MNDFLGKDGLHKGNTVLATNRHLYSPLSALLKIAP